MPLFYSRRESGNQITFVYKLQALSWQAMLFAVLAGFFDHGSFALTAFIYTCLAIAIIVSIALLLAKLEVKKLLDAGAKLQRTGSKFSFRNPVTVTLEKPE